jgi:hypothetical protein
VIGLRNLLAVVTLGAALAGPTAAHASVGSAYGDYSQDGAINGCDYSGSDLQGALGSIPTDVAQYDPRFKNALNNALAQRAGGCGAGGGVGAGGGETKKSAAAVGGSTTPPAADTAGQLGGETNVGSSEHGFPAVLGVLAGLVALIIAATALVAFARGRRPRSGGQHGFLSFFSDYYWGIRDTIGR